MAKVGAGQITVYDMNDIQKGATPPANPTVGTMWLNTNDWFVYTYNGTKWVLASPEYQNFRMEVTSSNGTQFRNGTVDTLLIANVYNGADDVSLNLPDSYFVWTKRDNEGNLDTAWNNSHANAGRIVPINSDDVEGKAVFECKVNIEFDEDGKPIINDPSGTPVTSSDVTLIGKWFPKTISGTARQSTIFTGSSIQATVFGTSSVTAHFDYSSQGFASAPNIAISIDGGAYTIKPLANTVSLATGLSKGVAHSIEIVYEGFAQADTVWTNTRALSFKHLEVEAKGVIAKATNNNRNVLFVGDGITQGMRAVSNADTTAGASAIKSFPYYTAKRLNANDNRASFGNVGINKTGNSGAPKIGDFVGFDALNVASNDSASIHTIVLMAGTADSTLDNATFKTHYQTLITKIRTYYATQRIYIVGLFVSGEKRNTILAELAKTNAKVTHIDTTSWASTVTTTDGTHPNNAGSTIAGNKIAEAMLIDGWESGGGLTPAPSNPTNPETPIDPTNPTNPEIPTNPNPNLPEPEPEVPTNPPTNPETPTEPTPVKSKNYTTVGRWYTHTEGGESVTSTLFVGSKLQFTVKGTTQVIGNFIYSARAFSQAPMIEISVNGGASTRVSLSDRVTLASGLTKTSTYTIEVAFDSHYRYERLWADNKPITIKDVEIDNGGTVTKTTNSKKNVLFVGNGMISGIRAIDTSESSSGNSGRLSFVRTVANRLGVNEVRSSFPSSGLNSIGDGNAPKIADFVLNNASGNAVGTDNINTILIYAGATEDSLSSDDFKTHYQALITKLRTKYTTQRIYIVGLLSGNKRNTELTALAKSNTKVTHLNSMEWSGFNFTDGIYLNESGAIMAGNKIADAMIADDWANGGGATPIPTDPTPPVDTNYWTGTNSLQPLAVNWNTTTGNGRILQPATYTISFQGMSTSGTSELNFYFEDRSSINQYIVLGKTYQTYTFTFTTTQANALWFNGNNDIYIKDILLISSTTGGTPTDPDVPQVPVKSQNFSTIGRWYTETINSETVYSTIYTGSTIQAVVSGTTSVKANFHYTGRAFSTAPMLSVSINSETPIRMSMADTVTLASDLSTAVTHTIDITIDSHAQAETLWNSKAFTIKNLEVDFGGTVNKRTNTSKNVLFVGDGVTSGFKLLSNVTTPAGGSSSQSYTRTVANTLGVNEVKASFIDVGVTKTGSGGAPKIADFVLNYNSGKVVGSDENIHTIVVYAGEADAGVASATFKTAYQELITKLRTKYPTQRIYIVGLTNATDRRNTELMELMIANSKVTHIDTTSLSGMAFTNSYYPNVTGSSILAGFISQTMISDNWANGGGALPPPTTDPIHSTNFETIGRWYPETINGVNAYSTVFVGSKISATVRGTTSIKANFHYSARAFTQAPIIAVSINGGAITKMNLADTVTLATGLNKATTYTVEITFESHYHYEYLWNAKAVTIKDIEVEYSGVVSKTTNTKRNILFMGDSITSGIRVLDTSDNASGNSSIQSYTRVVANALGVNDIKASFGGTGTTTGGVGGSPKVEDFALMNNHGKQVSGDNIHSIVLLVGENDYRATESAFKAGYQALLNKLRTYYATQRIYIVGLMNNLDRRNTILSDLSIENTKVTHINTALLTSVTFTDGLHPDVAGAIALGTFVKDKMIEDDWSNGGGKLPPPTTIPANVWASNGKSTNQIPLKTGHVNSVPFPDSYAGIKFTVSFKAHSPTSARLDLFTEYRQDFSREITLTPTATAYKFDFTVTYKNGGNVFHFLDNGSKGDIVMTNIIIKKYGAPDPSTEPIPTDPDNPDEPEVPIDPPPTDPPPSGDNLWSKAGRPTSYTPLPRDFSARCEMPKENYLKKYKLTFKAVYTGGATNTTMNIYTEARGAGVDVSETITKTEQTFSYEFVHNYSGDGQILFMMPSEAGATSINVRDIVFQIIS